jgi:hypothetical protein
MGAIAIADHVGDGVEVDLWGQLYTVKRRTKNTEEAIDEALNEINERAQKRDDLDKDATQVEIFGERMDVWLVPAAGGKKKPSSVIKEKWDAGDLDLLQVNSFWASVQEAAARPT